MRHIKILLIAMRATSLCDRSLGVDATGYEHHIIARLLDTAADPDLRVMV